MADFKDAIRSGLDEYLTGLKRAVDGLTPAELRWQPTLDSNHISWLVWHMARVEDGWMNERVGGGGDLWMAGGWREKLGFSGETSGYGDKPDDIRSMPDVPMDDLLAYYDAVRAAAFEQLDRLTEADLGRQIPHPRMKDLNLAWVLGHVLVEESQHLGQVAYIRGMIRGFGE